MLQRPKCISPGYYSITVCADSRRFEFDYHNEAILINKVKVD